MGRVSFWCTEIAMTKAEMYTTKAGERRFQVAAPVSEEAYEELRRLAFEQRTTIAAQVRQAIREYVGRAPSEVRSLGMNPASSDQNAGTGIAAGR